MKSDFSNANLEEAERLRWQLENAVTSRRAGRVAASVELQNAAHRLLLIGNFFQAGMAHLVLLQYDQADQSFREAQADFDIPEWDSSWWVANNAFLAGRYHHAAKLYCDYALKVNSDNIDAYRLAAKALIRSSEGSRHENHLKAIELLKKAVDLYEEGTLDWAKAMVDLGEAYRMYRVHHNATPKEQLQLSSQCYKKGLDALKALEEWDRWAEEASLYAAVMSLLDPPGQYDNTRAVLQLLEGAAEKIRPDGLPGVWSLLRLHTGVLYTRLPDSDDMPLMRHALTCYYEALDAAKGCDDKGIWAQASINIAGVISELPEFSRDVGLASAIEHVEAALQYWTLEREPLYYAACKKFLGDLRRGAKTPLNSAPQWYAAAYQSYEDALRIYRPDVCRDDYAECHIAMSNIVLEQCSERFATCEDRCRVAIEHCSLVIKAFADDKEAELCKQAAKTMRLATRRRLE